MLIRFGARVPYSCAVVHSLWLSNNEFHKVPNVKIYFICIVTVRFYSIFLFSRPRIYSRIGFGCISKRGKVNLCCEFHFHKSINGKYTSSGDWRLAVAVFFGFFICSFVIFIDKFSQATSQFRFPRQLHRKLTK